MIPPGKFRVTGRIEAVDDGNGRFLWHARAELFRSSDLTRETDGIADAGCPKQAFERALRMAFDRLQGGRGQ